MIVFGTIFLEFSHSFVLCRKSSNYLPLLLSLKLFWLSSVDGQRMEFHEMIMTKGKLFCFLSRMQHGWVVRVLDLETSDSISSSCALTAPWIWLNSWASLVHSSLVCLLPAGILNLLSLFELSGCLEIISVECLLTISSRSALPL